MKKPEVYLKEYCSRLTDENLQFLVDRLDARIGGDLSAAVDFLSNSKELDRWFCGAEECFSFYDMLDLVNVMCKKEIEKRYEIATVEKR
jgi:hypothetical protein